MNTTSPWWLLVFLPVALFAFPYYGARLLRKLERKMRRNRRLSVCPACGGGGCEFCGLPPPVDYVAMWIKYAMDNRYETKSWVHTMEGTPPARSTFEGSSGFWVRSRDPNYSSRSFYVWVPDGVAALDTTGKYRRGQSSPES